MAHRPVELRASVVARAASLFGQGLGVEGRGWGQGWGWGLLLVAVVLVVAVVAVVLGLDDLLDDLLVARELAPLALVQVGVVRREEPLGQVVLDERRVDRLEGVSDFLVGNERLCDCPELLRAPRRAHLARHRQTI